MGIITQENKEKDSGGVAELSPRPASAIGLTWGENGNREPSQVHIEWHAPCGCAFHPKPFPHIHPCSSEHKRPDLHTLTDVNLYHIQDSDRPMWAIAVSWQAALDKWKAKIREENDGEDGEPQGIQLVCEVDELLI